MRETYQNNAAHKNDLVPQVFLKKGPKPGRTWQARPAELWECCIATVVTPSGDQNLIHTKVGTSSKSFHSLGIEVGSSKME